ncbi:MAG: hypothetical protein QMD23_03775 [Candidatus Bathyarchaeia archaeon]|nr:hypothetical protein [Candidatus Bathyarchaeia archaeon]
MSSAVNLGLPNFEGLKKTKRRYVKQILGVLLKHGGTIRYGELLKKLDIPPEKKSTLFNNLDVLERLNFLTREKRGPIKLKFKTPLCLIAHTPDIPYAYLGLLGVKREWKVSETETALDVLKNVGIEIERITVVTTQEAIGTWSGAISPKLKIEWHTMTENDFNKVEIVEERVKPKILELMEKYILIMDCTSGTRPAGIAYYRLASQFRVPLIYVYEPEKRLLWLVSKEMLERELGGLVQL